MTSEVSLSEDKDLVEEVRDALAGLDETKIPSSTIEQKKELAVIPSLEKLAEHEDLRQIEVDSIIIHWTAELSFKSWFVKNQMMFGDVQVGVNVDQYKGHLEEQTDEALATAELNRDLEGGPVPIVDRTDGMLR